MPWESTPYPAPLDTSPAGVPAVNPPSGPAAGVGYGAPVEPGFSYGLTETTGPVMPVGDTGFPAPGQASPVIAVSTPTHATRAAVEPGFDRAGRTSQVPPADTEVPPPAVMMDDIWRQPTEDSAPGGLDANDVVFDGEPALDAPVTVGDLFDTPGQGKGHGFRNAFIVVLVLAVLGGLGYFGYSTVHGWLDSQHAADYPGPGQSDVTITIPKGASASTMGTILLNADVVASVKAFTNAVSADPMTFDKIQYGDHKLQTKMSGTQALEALADSSKIARRMVTIIEGLTYDQVFEKINSVTGISLDDLNAVAKAPSELALPDWAAAGIAKAGIEGFLFPDTYEYGMNPSAQALLAAMVTEFNSVTGGLDFVAKAKAEGLSAYQALVLASIIQKEGADPKHPEYAQNIAQVFLNRIAAKMPLQSDATVIYANHAKGTVYTNSSQRNIDSPYNTYKHQGLPPGPIASPGKTALSAAVNATKGNYLYFMVVNLDTNEIRFASTLADHNKNVKLLQTWCAAHAGRCTSA